MYKSREREAKDERFQMRHQFNIQKNLTVIFIQKNYAANVCSKNKEKKKQNNLIMINVTSFIYI